MTTKKFNPEEFAELSEQDMVKAIQSTKSVRTLEAMWEVAINQTYVKFSFLPLVAIFESKAFNSSQQLGMIKEITRRLSSSGFASARDQLLVCDLIAKYFVSTVSAHQEVFKYFVMNTLPVIGNKEIKYLTYSAPAMNDKMWATIMQGTTTQFGEALNFLVSNIVGKSNLIGNGDAFRNLIITIKELPWETNDNGAYVLGKLVNPDFIGNLTSSQCLTLLKVTNWFNADYLSKATHMRMKEAVLNRAKGGILKSSLR